MHKHEIIKRSLDDLIHTIKSARVPKLTIGKLSHRIAELSKPKKHPDESDDLVGPGSYQPKDIYLSTKCNSPTFKIGRSLRFKDLKIPAMKIMTSDNTSPKSVNSSFILSESNHSPCYTFKRTGHNLKLVDNPEFPGVGRYTPNAEGHNKSYTFNRSRREFNWKQSKRYLVNNLRSQSKVFKEFPRIKG